MSDQTTTNGATYDISPGDMAQPAVDGGPSFTLGKPEWLAVQTYVQDGRFLPTDETSFRSHLGSGAPSDLSDFQPLITAYAAINQHCTTWHDSTFPSTVALADAVYDYGTHKAPIYYPPILKEADILTSDPDNASAQAALKAILGVLQGAATDYAGKAGAVAAAIAQFATDSQSDEVTLVGTDGAGGLLKRYNDEYGSKSTEATNLAQQIQAQRQILDAANAEYNHDVIVAATSPSYAWVFPFGTIAAAVVAGVYGHLAVEALDKAKAAQAQIDSLKAEQAADANLISTLTWSTNSIGNISKALADALPVVQKIQGVWSAMAADLGAIARLIDTDIAQVPPIIMNLGVEEALKAWHDVALAADAYRVNAYITQSGGPADSMEASKVALQLASSRVPEPIAA
jgi:hypothetical protein